MLVFLVGVIVRLHSSATRVGSGERIANVNNALIVHF